MNFSIKKHITLLLIVFTLLPFFLLWIVAYPRMQADLKNMIMQNLEVIGHKQAELVDTWMHERMKDIFVVASNPFIVKGAKITEEDEDYLKIVRYLEMITTNYGYKGAFVSNEKGVVTLATSEGRGVGSNISKMSFFKQAKRGKTFVSSVMPSEVPLINEFEEEETGLPTMFVAAPLKDEDMNIIGVVSFRIDVNILSRLMSSYKFGKTGDMYLVNNHGYMLTKSRFTKHLKDMGRIKKRSVLELKVVDPETGVLTFGVGHCITGNDGSDTKGYNDYMNITVLGVWRWLPEFNWGVIIEIDKAEAYGAVYNLYYIGVALLLAIAFPIVFAAYYFARRLSIPIIQLTEVTEKMASGDLTQRVDIKRKDEIGALAASFNTMAKALAVKTKEITESEKYYREFFDSLKEGIYQCEPGFGGALTWINQAGAEMFGYESPEQIIGMKAKDIWGLDPIDRKRFWEQIQKEGICKSFVCHCKKRNGEIFYTERTSNLRRDKDGNPVCIQGVFRDVTEREKQKEKLQGPEKGQNDQERNE